MNGTDATWLPVVGYEGHYEVSDTGMVRSLYRVVETKGGWKQSHPAKFLTPAKANATGHQLVTLSRYGVTKSFLVHKLVLDAFVGPRPDGMWACHLNDVASDNRVENLRWDTPASNNRDAVRNGRHKQANKNHCKRGHEFTTANTYRTTAGRRQCRHCLRITRSMKRA